MVVSLNIYYERLTAVGDNDIINIKSNSTVGIMSTNDNTVQYIKEALDIVYKRQ